MASNRPAKRREIRLGSGQLAHAGSLGLLVSPEEFNLCVPPVADRRYALDCGGRSKIARLCLMPSILRQPCFSASFFMVSGVPAARLNLRRKSCASFISQDSLVKARRSRRGEPGDWAQSEQLCERNTRCDAWRRNSNVGRGPVEPVSGFKIGENERKNRILQKRPIPKPVVNEGVQGFHQESPLNQ
jgi:hypothetical protein